MIWISVKPEVTIDGDQEQFIAKGENFKLICRYNASPPVSEVQWIKNGEVITINATVTNGSRVTNIFYNGSLSQLSITSASAQDSGKYTCNVTNKVNGTIDSTSIVIQGMYTMFITCCTTFLRHYFSHCSGLNFSFEIFSCWKKANPAARCKHN